MPTDWMNKPSALRVAARYKMPKTAATTNTENGRPSR
jgi:hypothetical protein